VIDRSVAIRRWLQAVVRAGGTLPAKVTGTWG
jgi:hypothetical protein